MSTPLFRPEAVAHHEAGRRRRTEVDLRERGTARAFQFLVAGVLLALLAGYVVRADQTARGPATVASGGRTAEVLLPATAAVLVGAVGDLHGARATVTSVGEIRVSGGRAVVPVTVALDRVVPSGTATIALRRARVIDLVTGRG